MSCLRIAQIGCGYWGPNLLRNFTAASNCHVKYVVDSADSRLAYVRDNFPRTTAVKDLGLVLADPEVDAIVVATPAASHYALGLRALEAGKHIFVEKPLAMTVAEVDALAKVAEERKLTVMSGHTFLYNAAVRYLKTAITNGDIGKVFYLYAQRLNLGIVRSDVNVLWNLAPHDVSILLYLLGEEPVAVSAFGACYLQPGIEDVVFLTVEFASGVAANVQLSWLDPNKIRRMTVVGSKRMMVYDDVSDDKITIFDKGIDCETSPVTNPFDAPVPNKIVYRSGDIRLPKINFVEPMKTEVAHFLECVRTGVPPLSGIPSSRQVVRVLEAATASLKQGGAKIRLVP